MARTDPAYSPTRERATPLRTFRARIRALPGGRLAWRLAVTVVGVAVIAIGIVLLPLPGPGWLIIFAGLGVLGTEYAWAARLLRWVRARVRRWTRWIAAKPVWFRLGAGLLSLIVIAGLLVAAWFVPFGAWL
jgi:uncharacterized protein (TIGR02611 family)